MTYQDYTEEIKDNPYKNWHPTDINNALCDLADRYDRGDIEITA